MSLKKFALNITIIAAVFGMAACTTKDVVNGTVNTAGYVTKTAINGTIGAGKLVVRGVSGEE